MIVVIQSMTDDVVVDRKLLKNTPDVPVQRGARGAKSDNILLLKEEKVMDRRKYKSKRRRGKHVLNVEKLKKGEAGSELRKMMK